jgi:hypothetical protein
MTLLLMWQWPLLILLIADGDPTVLILQMVLTWHWRHPTLFYFYLLCYVLELWYSIFYVLDYVTISTFEKPYIIVITFENDKPYIYYYYRSQINTASTLWPAPHTLWQLPWSYIICAIPLPCGQRHILYGNCHSLIWSYIICAIATWFLLNAYVNNLD